MNPLETYLQSLFVIHSSGSAVKETSYYGTLESLLNDVGKTLKPKVRCIINLQNQGAGLPDGGFYTADQFQKRTKVDPLEGQLPARGCFEVKSPGEDVVAVAKGVQVLRYLKRYRQVSNAARPFEVFQRKKRSRTWASALAMFISTTLRTGRTFPSACGITPSAVIK